MRLCQALATNDHTEATSRRARLKRLLVPHPEREVHRQVDMAENLRRAGQKMKATIVRMNPWLSLAARGQGDSRQSGERGSVKRSYLLELPTELLLEIISHLSVLPEACLALTCKRLFAISGAILDSKSLHFSRDFAPLFHHYRNGHSFVTPRWQFIKIQEDGSRWWACSKCLKLHPRSFFPPRELRRKPEERTCNLGSLAGVVDLCPCRKLTFRDTTDLIDLLRVRQKSVALLDAHFGAGSGVLHERFRWHSCTESYGSTELRIELFPSLDEAGQLRIKTEYRLVMEPGQLGKEEHMTARFGCAHRSVDLWLAGVCQSAICQLYASDCTSCKRITVCNSCHASLSCPRKQPCLVDEESGKATYHFWTERCLGGASAVPDSQWAAQRIHPAETLVDVDNCSELCPWTVREHPPLPHAPSLGMDILDPAMQDQSLAQLYTSINMV